MGMQTPPLPKADIRRLWQLLEIQSPGQVRDGLYQPDLVWQRYNPYPKLQVGRPDQVVFVREDTEESTGLLNGENEITAGLLELVLPFPGAIEHTGGGKLKFTKLVTTRDPCGTIGYEQFAQHQNDPTMLRAMQRRREKMTIAAVVEDDSQQEDDQTTDSTDSKPLKVVYCADIDLMIPTFLQIRARPNEEDIKWEFENITFILNIIDVLSGETDYIDIRKRKPMYATLQVVESRIDEAKEREFTERAKYQAEYDKEVQQADMEKAETLEKYQAMVNDLLKKQREGQQINEAERIEKQQRLMLKQDVLNRRSAITKERLERELQREIKRIQRDVDLEIQRMQFKYKFMAVAIPWIPPFLVGLVVFVRRRLREREGIEKSRLR
jgi:ABC-2 type transport system permease protein